MFIFPGFNPRARTGRDTRRRRDQIILMFQSTRPHGARPVRCWGGHRELVSIHAPARGATQAVPVDWYRVCTFQSTRPHGARQTFTFYLCDDYGFNPRARTGRDSLHARRIRREVRFNPRARTGRDRDAFVIKRCSAVSIHAPARGATTTSL